ncbi:hypothetical protein Dvina_18960 [Dactylosporangium vinaceum]|uniref:Uncharacterized protein n=1 Tax=Dactylosporangium vinaceum TaxID=53362 RepID=A0ABV5M972_9ACTN|nr:hypothetical protein [Dactylosporangium vinaceum]UAB99948.1 hypothetical protein Dvina_18960 [Dactylosporangium vinaceum]
MTRLEQRPAHALLPTVDSIDLPATLTLLGMLRNDPAVRLSMSYGSVSRPEARLLP